MASAGYNGALAVQSEAALATISNMFIWGVTVLGCVMIFVMLFYKLDKEYPQIMKELLARESKKAEK